MWHNFYCCLLNKRLSGSGGYAFGLPITTLSRYVGMGLLFGLLPWLSSGCESYNLQRATFQACAKPSAAIGYATDQLEVVFSLENRQGDVGVVGWDLGDGRHKMGERIKVAYSQPGTYMVTIILANPCDDHFTTSRSVTVTK